MSAKEKTIPANSDEPKEFIKYPIWFYTGEWEKAPRGYIFSNSIAETDEPRFHMNENNEWVEWDKSKERTATEI